MDYARGAHDNAPLWFAVLAFAEQFHLHPQAAYTQTSLLWWERWQMAEKTKAARRAVEHARIASDYTKELTERERELIMWTERNDAV